MGPLWCTHQTASPVHSLRCSVSAGIDHEWRPDYFYRKGFQLFLHLGKLSAPHRHVGDLLISNMATSLIVRLLGASYQSSFFFLNMYFINLNINLQHKLWKIYWEELDRMFRIYSWIVHFLVVGTLKSQGTSGCTASCTASIPLLTLALFAT